MFRLPFRRPADPPAAEDPALTRALRAEFSAPRDPAYWDGLEARVMAAVRQGAGRVAERAAAPLEWWQALAGWGRPGLVAAAAILFLTGVVSSRISRGTTAGDAAGAGGSFRDLLGAPAGAGSALDPDLARILESSALDTAEAARVQAERDAAYLLSGGLERRPVVRLDSLEAAGARIARRPGAGSAGGTNPAAVRRADREATFRYVLPEE